MTVEGCPKEDDFPAGMRVLAVDDDPTCLKLLEGMLRRCKYHVTTTSRAINALKLLRENVDMFDLVLSDVHMPDMDGFKLLELIGLEMDLPVIMMSVNGETSTVMKGITHGACDYLLKPIRLEELRNIWQHVLRRRKGGSKNNKCGKVKVDTPVQGCNAIGHTDSNCKLVRKQREQNNEEDEEENSEKENDEQSSQKRPRVVWSVELHQKFVAAVNQLGIDKAFPKRILDIMNDDKLSRENVASHLQKYRLYLKRMANQQGNMNPLGARDSSFLPIDRFRDFNSQGMIQEFSNPRLTSQGATTLGGLNSRDSTFNSSHNSPVMIQLGYMPTLKNPIDDLRKANHTTLSGHYQGNMFQASPTLSQVNCLQNKSSLLGYDGSSTLIGDGLSFSVPRYQPTNVCSFSNDVLSNAISSNTFLSVPNNPTRIEVIQPNHGQYMGTENLSEIIQEQIYANSGSSSRVPELDGCNKSLQNATQMMRYSAVLPMVHPQKSAASGLNNNSSWRPSSLDPNMVHPVKSAASGLNEINSWGTSSLDPNVVDLSSLSTITATSYESAYGRQLTQATRGDESTRHFSLGNDDASKFSSLSRSTGNGTPWSSTGCTLKQGFDIQQALYDNSLNAISGSSICPSFQPHQLVGHPNQYSAKPNGDGLFGEDNFDWAGQGALTAPLYAMQPVAAKESTSDDIVKLENHLLSNTRFPDILDTNGASDCLVDIVSTLKRRERDLPS